MSDQTEKQKPTSEFTPRTAHVGATAVGFADMSAAVARDDRRLREQALSTPGHKQRVPQLRNGRREFAGGAALITPDATAIADIEAESPGKIKYFPTPQEAADFKTGKHINEPEFARLIMDPLIDELRQRFPGKRLALRGVGTSINGRIATDKDTAFVLQDIADTVEQGVEKPGETFNVAVLGDDDISVHRVNQYACGIGINRALYAEPEQEDAMFPAILVYDTDGLQKTGQSYYGVSFREDHAPQDVLMAAYILDCPAV